VSGTPREAATPRVEAQVAAAKPAPAPQPVAPSELVYSVSRVTPADPASPGTASQPAPPLEFAVLAAIVIAGQPPVLTLQVGGNAVTVREGDVISGYRVERIDRDRVTLVHVASGSRSERLYADAAPVSSSATVASAASAPAAPFAAQTQSFGPIPANAPANRISAPSTSMATPPPPVNYVPPRPPAGATVHDNPLVGAVLPSVPGQAPPGMSGPRPSPARPGDPVPQGPMPTPVPPNAQGPTRR